MSLQKRTDIGWADHTWNPLHGCDRISPGCDRCYAANIAAGLKRKGVAGYQRDGDPRTSGPGFAVTCEDRHLEGPILGKGSRGRVFAVSMGDPFHQEVPLEFLQRMWDVMARTPWRTYIVLTKRIQRAAEVAGRLPWPPNIVMGTSVELDSYAFRADHLRRIPAAVRLVSAEPLLGPLPSLDLDGIGWVIAGGESQRGARPCDPEWLRDLRDRCADRGIPFYLKQLGGHPDPRADALAVLDGRTHVEFPRTPEAAPVGPVQEELW